MMKKHLKRLGDWVISSKDNHFLIPKLKLVFIYILSVGIIISLFSVAQYNDFVNVTRESLGNLHIDKKEAHLRLERSKVRFRLALLRIGHGDIVTIVVILAAGHFMSELTLRPIRESMQFQKKFLADVSHELKTPLSIIKTEFEVTLRNKNNIGKKFIWRKRNTILSNLEEINQMSKLLDDLLIIARIDLDQDQIRLSKIDIKEFLQEIVIRINLLYQKKREIDLLFSTKKPIYIEADTIKLQQAFNNLLKNAIDYSPVQKPIKIKVEKSLNLAIISFIDRGIGIPKEDVPYIFNRFYRGKNVSGKTPGSGLGLSIVKWIIEKHRGSIAVKSIINKGTIFKVSLPLIKTS